MTRSTIHLAFAITCFALAALAYFAFFSALMLMRNDAASLTAEVAAMNATASDDQFAAHERASIIAAESTITGYFVDPDNIVAFLEGVQALGASEGATVTVSSVTASPTPRPHLDLALRVEGSFDAVVRTTGAVEYEPYDIETESYALTSSDAHWTGDLTVSVGTTATSTPASDSKPPPP